MLWLTSQVSLSTVVHRKHSLQTRPPSSTSQQCRSNRQPRPSDGSHTPPPRLQPRFGSEPPALLFITVPRHRTLGRHWFPRLLAPDLCLPSVVPVLSFRYSPDPRPTPTGISRETLQGDVSPSSSIPSTTRPLSRADTLPWVDPHLLGSTGALPGPLLE